MWTLRLPPAMASMVLVDISRWSFLPRKTLQSETTETTYQRPENCKAARWLCPGTGATKHTATQASLEPRSWGSPCPYPRSATYLDRSHDLCSPNCEMGQ